MVAGIRKLVNKLFKLFNLSIVYNTLVIFAT
jgi:hypothetical protein